MKNILTSGKQKKIEGLNMKSHLFGKRYRIKKLIGEGGMASVYEAVDEKLNRKVAIKILHSHLCKNQDIRKRFHLEAHSLSGINHPNIINIYDFSGIESEKLWIVTEILKGKNLAKYVEDYPHNRLHPIIATLITAEVSKALLQAHSQGIIHRDIKPENIMVLNKGQIKLMDFGISKDVRQKDLTITGTFIGSPSYMSPEQIHGADIDHKSDIYSLSVLFYEILTGTLPFIGKNTADVINKIMIGRFAEPRIITPNTPFQLNNIIMQGMQKSRDNRFKDIVTLLKELNGFLLLHGFMESHIELERFFNNRDKFEKRLEKLEFKNGAKPYSFSQPRKQTTPISLPPRPIHLPGKGNSNINHQGSTIRKSPTPARTTHDGKFGIARGTISKSPTHPPRQKVSTAPSNRKAEFKTELRNKRHSPASEKQRAFNAYKQHSTNIHYRGNRSEDSIDTNQPQTSFIRQALGIILITLIGVVFGLIIYFISANKINNQSINKAPSQEKRTTIKDRSLNKKLVQETRGTTQNPPPLPNIQNGDYDTRNKKNINSKFNQNPTFRKIENNKTPSTQSEKDIKEIKKSVLFINSNMTAKIYIDDEFKGFTYNKEGITVSPGTHKIELRRPNHESLYRTVFIKEGDKLKLKDFIFGTKAMVWFKIQTFDTPAKITIKDATSGQTVSFFKTDKSTIKRTKLKMGRYIIRTEYESNIIEKLVNITRDSQIFTVPKGE